MKTRTQLLRPSILLLVVARSALAAEYENNLDKSFSVTPGGKLVIQADRGSITVATDGSDTARIEVFRKIKGGTREKADEMFKNHEVKFA